SLFLHSHDPHRDLHSFPTRRSSDLGGQPVRAEAALGEPSQLVGQANGGVERLASRYQPVRESHPKRFVAVDSAAGQDEVHRVARSEEHTSELQSLAYLVCRLLLEKK